MDNNKITGFDLITFVSLGLMSIEISEDGIKFTTDDALSEMLSERTGLDVTTELLNHMLSHFAEFASSATYSLEENAN